MRMRAGQRATEQDRSLFTYLFALLFFVSFGLFFLFFVDNYENCFSN